MIEREKFYNNFNFRTECTHTWSRRILKNNIQHNTFFVTFSEFFYFLTSPDIRILVNRQTPRWFRTVSTPLETIRGIRVSRYENMNETSTLSRPITKYRFFSRIKIEHRSFLREYCRMSVQFKNNFQYTRAKVTVTT